MRWSLIYAELNRDDWWCAPLNGPNNEALSNDPRQTPGCEVITGQQGSSAAGTVELQLGRLGFGSRGRPGTSLCGVWMFSPHKKYVEG